MHTTRRQESFVTLRNSHDFAVFVGILVIAMDGLDLVHLYGLGDTDADFCFSLTTSRAAALYPCHRDQPSRMVVPVKRTYGHVETVHVGRVHLFA